MSKPASFAEETIYPVDVPLISAVAPRHGGRGQNVYKAKEPLRWYILCIVNYTVATSGVLVWASLGPALPGGKRVLRTGSLHVDQFYSGLALSALLTPAAILIRKISKDVGLLHPFSIAARTPVQTADLDLMMDPGPFALRTVFTYSWWRAGVQAILMIAGALLVPIGTLIVTTGPYAAQTSGEAVIGLPIEYGGAMTMSISMDQAFTTTSKGYYGSADFFLGELSDIFKGSFVSQSGMIAAPPTTLGPLATTNITLVNGVRYYGIITYQWDGGCESAFGEISYSVAEESDAWMSNFTFPDGTLNGTDVWDPTLYMWSDATEKTLDGVPLGGTTYFAASCALNATVHIPEDTSTLAFVNGTWISLVKCKPSLQWQISSCVWDGSAMGNCSHTPGQNTTSLDTVGLDALSGYMTALPWTLYNGDEYAYGVPIVTLDLVYYPGNGPAQYRAPTLDDYNNLFGVTAQSIAAVTSAGYYGVAVVPTVGTEPQRVYIARLYILGIVLAILVAVFAASALDLIYSIIKHLPIRKTTFLTIANAVRGRWWDQELYGGCALRDDDIRRMNRTEVMFGVDAANPEHIGFAPTVYGINENAIYYGVEGNSYPC